MRDLAQRTVRTDMLVKTSVEQLTEHMDGKIDAVSTQVSAQGSDEPPTILATLPSPSLLQPMMLLLSFSGSP